MQMQIGPLGALSPSTNYMKELIKEDIFVIGKYKKKITADNIDIETYTGKKEKNNKDNTDKDKENKGTKGNTIDIGKGKREAVADATADPATDTLKVDNENVSVTENVDNLVDFDQNLHYLFDKESKMSIPVSRLSFFEKLYDFQEIIDPTELTTESLEENYFPVYPLKEEGKNFVCTYASLLQVRPDIGSEAIMQSLVYVTEQEHGMIVNEKSDTLDEIFVDMNDNERDLVQNNNLEDEEGRENENIYLSQKNKKTTKNRRKYTYCRLTVDLPNSNPYNMNEDNIYNRKRHEILCKSKSNKQKKQKEEQTNNNNNERKGQSFNKGETDANLNLNDSHSFESNSPPYPNEGFDTNLIEASGRWDLEDRAAEPNSLEQATIRMYNTEIENNHTNNNFSTTTPTATPPTTSSISTTSNQSLIPEGMDMMDLGNLQWEFTSIDIQLVIDRRTRLRYLLFRFIKKLPLKGLAHFEYKISRRKFIKQAHRDLNLCKDQWDTHCKKKIAVLTTTVEQSMDKDRDNSNDQSEFNNIESSYEETFTAYEDVGPGNENSNTEKKQQLDHDGGNGSSFLNVSPPVSLFSAMTDIMKEEKVFMSQDYGNMNIACRRKYLSPFYLSKKRPETRSYLEDVKRVLYEDNISLHSISSSQSRHYSSTNNNNNNYNNYIGMMNQIDSHYMYQIESLCKEKIELRLDLYTFALDNFIQDVELKCTELINYLETTFTQYNMYLPYLKPAKTLNEYNLDLDIGMTKNGSDLSILFENEIEQVENEGKQMMRKNNPPLSTVGYSNIKKTESFKSYIDLMISRKGKEETATTTVAATADSITIEEKEVKEEEALSMYFILENLCKIDTMYYMHLVENEVELYARLKRKVQQVSDRLNQLQGYLKRCILMLRDSVNKATGSAMVQQYTKCLSVASEHERKKFEEQCRNKRKNTSTSNTTNARPAMEKQFKTQVQKPKKEERENDLNYDDSSDLESLSEAEEELGISFYTQDDYLHMPEILNIHDREIPISECQVFYNNNTRISTLYLTYWHIIIINKPTILSSVFPPFVRVLKFCDILNIKKTGNNGISNLLVNSNKLVMTVKKQQKQQKQQEQQKENGKPLASENETDRNMENKFGDRYAERKRKIEAEEEITLVPSTKGDEIEAILSLIKVLICLHSKEQ